MICPDCRTPMYGQQYILTTEDYDGVSEWRCSQCHVRIGRWTKRRLTDGELEPRYGIKKETPA